MKYRVIRPAKGVVHLDATVVWVEADGVDIENGDAIFYRTLEERISGAWVAGNRVDPYVVRTKVTVAAWARGTWETIKEGED